MAQKNERDRKLTLREPGRLQLKKTVSTGQVRQSFSHGRSNTVAVEVKKKRTFTRDDAGTMRSVAETAQPQPDEAPTPVPSEDDGLTDQERETRIQALQEAAGTEEQRHRTAAEEAAWRAEEQRLREEREQRESEDDERRAAAAARRRAEEEKEKDRAQRPASAPARARPAEGRPVPGPPGPAREEQQPPQRGKRRTADQERPSARPRGERRRESKLTINKALEQADGLDEQRIRSLAAIKRAKERERQRAAEMRESGETSKIVRDVVIPETITVADLANRMAVSGNDVVRSLMKLGSMAGINQTIDADTAELVVTEFGHRVKRVSEADVEIGLEVQEDAQETLAVRPPIVTIMGHVDHGKTSLLDALRETSVAAGEAGGITQHIGAYQVALSGGRAITFIDTPGHEAFTEMRSRGADVTDIVVLVVAADDGVQPQTAEAISHAREAGVPLIIAINKIDRPEANPDRIRQELLNHEVVVEKLGGDILDVEVSAVEKQNLDKLEEVILLQAELLELRANPDRLAQGVVIEGRLEKGRGSVATVLVQRGTLRTGDLVIASQHWGRVRALSDEHGKIVKQAGPSMPVEVLGLQGVPAAGDRFLAVEDEGQAKDVAEYRERLEKQKTQAVTARGTLEQMFDRIKEGEVSEIPVVLRADVQGSVEAIVSALSKLGTEEVAVRIMHAAVGGITESDVVLAKSAGGIVVGFNVRPNPQARQAARADHVDIRYYSVIYELIDDIKLVLGDLLAPEVRERQLGYAEIREIFGVSKVGNAAGCYITEGAIRRGSQVRLLRDEVVIYTGALKSLRRFKENVREVQQGYECGMAFENFDDIKQGDVVECFETEEVARGL